MSYLSHGFIVIGEEIKDYTAQSCATLPEHDHDVPNQDEALKHTNQHLQGVDILPCRNMWGV